MLSQPTTDLTEFAETWQPYFARIAGRLGLRGPDAEDAVQTALLAFVEEGLLDRFDPTLASFGTYVAMQARYRMLRYRHSLVSHWTLLDDDADLPDETAAQDFDMIDLHLILQVVYAQLACEPGGADLAALLHDLVEQVVRTGRTDVTALAQAQQCSRQGVYYRLKKLVRTPTLERLRVALAEVQS